MRTLKVNIVGFFSSIVVISEQATEEMFAKEMMTWKPSEDPPANWNLFWATEQKEAGRIAIIFKYSLMGFTEKQILVTVIIGLALNYNGMKEQLFCL